MNGSRPADIIPGRAKIVDRRELAADTILVSVSPDSVDAGWITDFTPGQFFQLSVPGGGEVPISPASSPPCPDSLEFCVRRVGHVTNLLHALGSGDRIGIRGPYGNGFPVDDWRGSNILLLAGGLGIAPLRSLLRYLLAHRDGYGEITLMYGAREPSAILFKEELASLMGRRDMRLFLTVDFYTEDPGSGLVCNTGLLPELLHGVTLSAEKTAVAICGPPPLYRCVIDRLLACGISPDRIHLSLERRMKCGIGLCCHCAVGDLFCCTDGPVFRLSDIRQIEGAL